MGPCAWPAPPDAARARPTLRGRRDERRPAPRARRKSARRPNSARAPVHRIKLSQRAQNSRPFTPNPHPYHPSLSLSRHTGRRQHRNRAGFVVRIKRSWKRGKVAKPFAPKAIEAWRAPGSGGRGERKPPDAERAAHLRRSGDPRDLAWGGGGCAPAAPARRGRRTKARWTKSGEHGLRTKRGHAGGTNL